MTYQVLARKWRPKSFASLVGQEHVVRALTHALDGGRLHHAYLFTGTRGVGKTTLSRIFAKALNCETGVTSTPCGVCRACKEIDEGRFVDYVEMDAASNRGVEEMAALLERAVYAPVDARFKVYMIDEVHMLTNHAFNAMLKTLEEPPAHVKFILATTDPQKIPVTVLSRCLQFNLKQMPAGHIVGHLEHVLAEEQIPYESQALRLLARAADGSMRDALSLTDQAIAYSANRVTEEAVSGMLGALDQSYLIRLLDALAAGDGEGVLAIADEMALRSLSFSTALQDLAGLLHRVAWAQFAPASVLDEWPEATDIRRFADSLSAEQVQLFYQIATIGRGEMGLAPDEYAGFTMTLLRMLAFEPAGGPGGGGARVSAPAVAGSARSTAPRGVAASGGARAALNPAIDSPTDAVTRGVGMLTPVPAQARIAASPATTNASPARPVAHDETASSDASKLNVPVTASGSVEEDRAHQARTDQVRADQALAGDAAEIDQSSDSIVEADMVEGAAAVSGATSDLGATATDITLTHSDEGAPRPGTDNGKGNGSGADDLTPVAIADAQDSQPTTQDTDSLQPGDSPPPFSAAHVDVVEDAEPAAKAAEELPSPLAVAAQQLIDESSAKQSDSPLATQPEVRANASPRASGGASAALDVLRSAGMRVSSDRGARAAEPVRKRSASKPVAPVVQVPSPRRPAAPATSDTPTAAMRADARDASGQAKRVGNGPGNAVAPWDDMPPEDYVPASSEDDYFLPPDDGFMPAFDNGPDDGRFNEAPAFKPALKPEARTLPAAIPLDAIGVSGDWPALAIDLPLKGIAYQLAFNSELTACDADSITLTVSVPLYAESAHVAKLKSALAEKLGRGIGVVVSVGPAHRTAAALDAATRAKRQQQAEQEITQDPFVQSLIRDFGASIVQGSIKPLAA
ncbi:DNA polymerase III subunit gamma/tau, partial [Caballeronia sp.]|uniref:DNA polymerase III subunit gamma/tau n=1 Tax=Caballeronia sp. TaxID=1931223 RepID=UPI003C3830AD